MLLPLSLALGEQLIPNEWTPVLLLALGSQVLGQGLLVYAIGALPPLVVGLALLTQPAISAFIGWVAYRETLSPLDWLGAGAIALALVLVRFRRGLRGTASTPHSPMDEPTQLESCAPTGLCGRRNAVFDGWTAPRSTRRRPVGSPSAGESGVPKPRGHGRRLLQGAIGRSRSTSRPSVEGLKIPRRSARWYGNGSRLGPRGMVRRARDLAMPEFAARNAHRLGPTT